MSQPKPFDAWIFTGGDWSSEKCRALLEEYSGGIRPRLILAADSGYKKALALEIVPDLLVGDFDSMERPASLPEGVEIYVSPCEKDDTDTMLACSLAIEKGASSLLILGGTGGRADHGLSNILYLESLRNRGVDALLTDGENRIRVCRDCTLTLPDRGGYFSVMSLSDRCTVTLTGCKYPLTNAVLRRELPYAVSNEVVGEAKIVLSGTAAVMETVK